MLVMGPTMFEVRSLEAKNRIFQHMKTLESVQCKRNDVRVSSMSNLVNLVKALLGWMFYVCSFKGKNRILSFNTNRQTRLSSFNVQRMMLEFV